MICLGLLELFILLVSVGKLFLKIIDEILVVGLLCLERGLD